MAITKYRFFIGQSERKSTAVRPMEGIKRKTISGAGRDPRNGRSWHEAGGYCGAAFLPRLNELKTELAKGRDSGK
jgi:hypothetical protein